MLSIEMLSDYIHDKVLPNLIMDILKETVKSVRTRMENNKEEYSNQLRRIFKGYELTCVSPATIYRWMVRIGFRCQPTREGHYVNGHKKRPATIQYRWDFCQRYLSNERRMHRWVQVMGPLATKLEAENLLAKGSGYKYIDGGTPIWEYHVDCFNPEKSKDL
jgi:hypothetical protein